MNDQRTAQNNGGHRDTRQVERDIERTRGAIDRTLDEIGDRLHPQNLLHQAIDVFRSDEGEPNEWAIELRRSGRRIARKVKRNPLPAILIGAGAAWLWMQDENEARRREIHSQWADLPEHGGSVVDARTGEPYEGKNYGKKYVAAWHSGYDWSDSHDDETSWSSRAEAAMNELRQSISDTTRSAKERLGLVAGKMASLSGMKKSEIQRALRAQWDDLPEHSGSFVDARTGKPYDDSYGEEWRHLAAIDTFHSASSSASSAQGEEEEGWGERAEAALHSIQSTLSDTTGTVKDRLAAVGSQLSKLAESSRSYSAKYGQSGRRKLGAMARGTQHRAQQLGRQVGSGYESTRDYLAETIDDNPLVSGVAVLGLGLLVGSLLPSTRLEDEALGEQADELKARGAEVGREVLERGQEMAASAGEAAYEEAKRQGLTPSQLAEQAREGIDKLAGAAKENAPAAGDLRSKAAAVVERATEAAKESVKGETHAQHSTGSSGSGSTRSGSASSGGASSGTSAAGTSYGGTSDIGGTNVGSSPSGAAASGSLGSAPAACPTPGSTPQSGAQRTPPTNP